MPKTRRQFAGGAVASTITGSVAASGVTTFSVAASTNWSTSTTIPFYVVVSPQTSSEEKMLVTLSSNTLTIVSRGVDGTSASSHASGASIYPVFTATDANEANELTSKYANRGSIVYQGASTFEELAKGTQGYPLVIGANDPAWSQLDTGGIADNAVTAAKIAAGAVDTSELAANAVTLAKLATAVQNLLVPVGTIAPYAGATAPTGWLLCDGTTSTSGYTALAALVGATTPNMKGKFLMGVTASGTGSTLLGSGGTTTIGEGNLPSHTHTFSATSGAMSANSTLTHSITDPGHTHNSGTNAGNFHPVDPSGYGPYKYSDSDTQATTSSTTSISIANHTVSHTHDVSGTTGTGSGSGNAYYQPFVAVNYIIKHD